MSDHDAQLLPEMQLPVLADLPAALQWPDLGSRTPLTQRQGITDTNTETGITVHFICVAQPSPHTHPVPPHYHLRGEVATSRPVPAFRQDSAKLVFILCGGDRSLRQ